MRDLHMLTHVTEDQLELGEAVQHPVGDNAQDVHVEAVRIAQRREVEPRATIPHQLVDELVGGARVHVDGGVELVGCLPEHVVLGLVEVKHAVAVLAAALVVIQQRSDEALLLRHAATELCRRLRRVVHAERGKGGEPVWRLHHLVLQAVVCQSGLCLSFGLVGDALTPGGIEGEDHEVNIVFVHLFQAHLMDVEQLAGQAGAGARRDEFARIIVRQLLRHGPALFNSNLAEHGE